MWHAYEQAFGLQFSGDQDSEWLHNVIQLALMHGDVVEFGAYTLESMVEITQQLQLQRRRWMMNL